jgi:hypothetical protein
MLQTGTEQNLFSDQDVFAYVRSNDGTGCAPDHSKERILIVINKGPQSRAVQFPMNQTSLTGCSRFLALQPAEGLAPSVSSGTLHVEERAESMTVYEAR